MKRLAVEKQGLVGWIALDDGKANAIQDELLSQLDVALETCERDPDVRAVVLTGREGLFSAGMDLKLLPTLAEADLRATLRHLGQTVTHLFTFSKPTVAALTGHAIAGGMVLALCCDLRLAALGPFKLGLSEVALGIPLPAFVIGLVQDAVPQPLHAPMILHGNLLAPDEAHRQGLVHALCPAGELGDRARAQAEKLAELDPAAYAATKRTLRAEVAAARLARFDGELERFARSFRMR